MRTVKNNVGEEFKISGADEVNPGMRIVNKKDCNKSASLMRNGTFASYGDIYGTIWDSGAVTLSAFVRKESGTESISCRIAIVDGKFKIISK